MNQNRKTTYRELVYSLQALEKAKVAETLREHLGQGFGGVGVGLWHLNCQTERAWFSDAWRSQLGLAGEDVGSSLAAWRDRIHPEDRDAVLSEWAAARDDGGSDLQLTFRLRHNDGGYREVLSQVLFSKNDEGEVVEATVAQVDLTRERRLEHALNESEQRFAAVLESLPGSVFVHDIQGRLLFVNQTACKQTGYAWGELLGMQMDDIDPGCIERDDAASLWPLLREGISVTVQTEFVRKSGTSFPAELRLSAMQFNGVPVILAIGSDVSDRERTHALLHATQERYEQIAEGTFDVVLESTLELEVTRANPASDTVLGQDPAALAGVALDVICDTATCDRLRRLVAEVSDGDGIVLRTELRHRSGTPVPVELRACVLHGEDGTPQAIQLIARDLSELERLESEREGLLLAIGYIADSAVYTDDAGSLQYANPAFATQTGQDALEDFEAWMGECAQTQALRRADRMQYGEGANKGRASRSEHSSPTHSGTEARGSLMASSLQGNLVSGGGALRWPQSWNTSSVTRLLHRWCLGRGTRGAKLPVCAP